jgi:hypothetical protein
MLVPPLPMVATLSQQGCSRSLSRSSLIFVPISVDKNVSFANISISKPLEVENAADQDTVMRVEIDERAFDAIVFTTGIGIAHRATSALG